MAYEFKRSKKDKASIIPIEETYTNYDVRAEDTNVPEYGYRFDTPRRWYTSRSQNKSIGIRDLHLKAHNATFNCRFLLSLRAGIPIYPIEWDGDNNRYNINWNNPEYDEHKVVEENIYISDLLEVRATSNNSFEEVFYDLTKGLEGNVWQQLIEATDEKRYITIDPGLNSGRGDLWVQSTFTDNNDNIIEDNYSEVENAGVKNIYLSPIPTNIMYRYDAETANLGLYVNGIHRILVKNHNNYERFQLIPAYVDKSDSICQTVDDVLSTEEEFSGAVYCCRTVPQIFQASILMIIDGKDADNFVSCYKFFNQPIPVNDPSVNRIKDLVTINIDNTDYIVPFITCKKSDATHITLNNDYNGVFKSHFILHSRDEPTLFSTPVGIKENPSDDVEPEADNLTNNPYIHTNLDLRNVWDRTNLYYHASFANTKHKIIGRNGDHWDTPNKQFFVDDNSMDQFNIYFTSNGRHRILPHGCVFNIDLTFLLNPTNNTATYRNHDSFKD